VAHHRGALHDHFRHTSITAKPTKYYTPHACYTIHIVGYFQLLIAYNLYVSRYACTNLIFCLQFSRTVVPRRSKNRWTDFKRKQRETFSERDVCAPPTCIIMCDAMIFFIIIIIRPDVCILTLLIFCYTCSKFIKN